MDDLRINPMFDWVGLITWISWMMLDLDYVALLELFGLYWITWIIGIADVGKVCDVIGMLSNASMAI